MFSSITLRSSYGLGTFYTLLLGAVVMAAEPSPRTRAVEQVQVIGTPSQRFEIPGSAHVLDDRDIRAQSYDDINRILRKVPGVYVREEDGFGLFPNISLRGVDTSRSAKITLMEDGVLTAPAPYAAPSAYYSPTAGRMSSLEVLKGSSQVKYGPHITGGVLNYLSTDIPQARHAYIKALYGSDDEMRVHGWWGDSLTTEHGRIGYVLETFFRTTDGFKRIDAAPGFGGSDETGFTNIEPMLKIAFEPNASLYQRFEAKLGYSNMEADETYLGLADNDLKQSPFRRYAASRFDNIDTEHYRSYLRYYLEPSADVAVSITGYYNRFARDWFKLNDLRSVGTGGNMSLSAALAGAANGQGLACLQARLDCVLRVRHNDRAYKSYGVELKTDWRLQIGNAAHRVSAGIRYHEDYEDREQRNERYTQNTAGFIVDRTPGLAGDAGDRRDSVDAIAFYLQDSITWRGWTFVPGLRFETLDLERDDRRNDTLKSAELDMFGGGLGISYAVGEDLLLFGGIYRGFSPPSPGAAINNRLNEETSWSYEGGLRYARANGTVAAELVGFYTQFDDLIVVDNIGGTGTGNTQNFGEVDTFGLELSGQYDLATHSSGEYSAPLFVAFTWTKAEQQNDAVSTDPESIFSFGADGNEVPYIPEITVTVGAGLHLERIGGEIVASFSDETYTSANNVSIPVNGNGDLDARFGRTDSYWTVDLSGYYRLSSTIKLLGGIQNLLDEEYIVSRQPHGARPGPGRFSYVGAEFEFDL